MATSLRKIPGGPDSTTVKFLFAVIKQLETKAVSTLRSCHPLLISIKVNWQHVADEMGITNGHAARMRFSRLKAQVEGTAPYGKSNKTLSDGTPRKQRKTDIRTVRKREAERLAAEGATGTDPSPIVKTEPEDADADAHADDEHDFNEGFDIPDVKQHEEVSFKTEPGLEEEIMMV